MHSDRTVKETYSVPKDCSGEQLIPHSVGRSGGEKLVDVRLFRGIAAGSGGGSQLPYPGLAVMVDGGDVEGI